jgi:hypothetical protein
MALITPMIKLNDMYAASPQLIDDFFTSCERLITEGKEVVFTANTGQGKIIRTLDSLALFRESIEGRVERM